jgi:hypothetical protein
MVSAMLLLVILLEVRQLAELVSAHVITSPSEKSILVNVLLFDPELMPFIFH